MSKEEFAAALKSLGVPVKTAAGAKRVERARKILNAKAEAMHNLLSKDSNPFDSAQPRYQRRWRQAKHLWYEKSPENLTTYDRFLLERSLSDAPLAGVQAEAAPEPSPKPGAVISFLENNFRIRDSGDLISGEPVSDQPAKVSWTHPHGEDSYYTVDAAVLYTPKWLDYRWLDLEKEPPAVVRQWLFGGRIRPEFEAHLSTQDGADRNELKYATLFQGRTKYFPGGEDNTRTESLAPEKLPFLSASYFELAPTYVTDRVANIRTWGVDAKYEPSIPWLNLNHDNPRRLFNLPWLEGKMTGHVGFTFRSYDRGAAINGKNDSYGEFSGQYEADLTLFSRLTLSAKYTAAANVWGDMESHDYFEGSAQVTLDPANHFTFGVSYLKGETEPTFKEIDTVTAWVGVQF